MTQDRSSSSGNPWERGFELSYKFACEKLAKISDIKEQCRKSGARYLGPHEIVVNYLNQSYHIMLLDGKILLESIGVEAALRDKILILHYFTGAKGTLATGKLIAYKQLPGGVSYFSALLRKVAAKLGGCDVNYGDVSVSVNAFDRVPITLVLWRGDEELAPNGNILFDANISDYLSTEDVTVLCETIIWKLVKGSPSA